MIKSMTGYGKAEHIDKKRHITIEIKSVNHRYGDIHVKLPKVCNFAENDIKKSVRKYVKRGKADVFVKLETLDAGGQKIRINEALAKNYYEAFCRLEKIMSLPRPKFESVLEIPDIITIEDVTEDEDELKELLCNTAEKAAEALDNMRKVEGEKLAEDLLMRGAHVQELVDDIREKAPLVPKMYREKLMERMKELLDGVVEIPEEKILQETAFFADKANIDEEITRLDSHMNQLKLIIEGNHGTCGKKLDFLVQEMNREANTIGSKANGLEITEVMLKVKAEVEKIREQVQNIE